MVVYPNITSGLASLPLAIVTQYNLFIEGFLNTTFWKSETCSQGLRLNISVSTLNIII